MPTDGTSFTSLISLLIALSVATERVVEIVKGAVPPLNRVALTPRGEAWRRCGLQALAVGAGMLTVWLAGDAVPPAVFRTNSWGGVVVLGLLASGGSGFWNAVLTYAVQVKNVKAAEAGDKTDGPATTGNP